MHKLYKCSVKIIKIPIFEDAIILFSIKKILTEKSVSTMAILRQAMYNNKKKSQQYRDHYIAIKLKLS